ncbi:uncharacterized protein EI90DRAFT_3073689 [Cantharellus anzutake]|uniref:uncharacterized protein n=1 Tax=Cantharellus anzutake TaxID=1750568 RepID=UPI0019044E33|nr:uncharacterized protein EI90DRAFT_3073689 [Cantharellus anzutake]KAF8325279.1 hypothetical protein EI90DRAFT_3073689 [Cantharellus anzutake]
MDQMEASLSPSVDGRDHDEAHKSNDEQRDKSAEPDTGDASGTNKPGRKKAATSNQAARRDQNRIAQREFRLRKQQRIRDLEARVEILSGSKEETHTHSRAIIQGLMEENSRLRALVRDLGTFLGDGLGGPLLAKTGWDMKSFQDMVSRADSDTAYEAFIKAKNAMISPQNSTGMTSSTSALASGGHDLNGTKKRKRSSFMEGSSFNASQTPPTPSNSNPPRARSPHELPSLLPSRTQPFNPTRSSDEPPGSFTSLIDTFSSSAGAPYIDMGNPSISGTRVLPPPGPREAFGMASVGMNNGPSGGSSSYGGSSFGSFNPRDNNQAGSSPINAPPAASTTSSNAGPTDRRTRLMIENEPKKHEAGKLIKYHLDNYKRSSQYFLPASLRPTLVQRSVPHDNLIDGIVYPEIRDRMILLKDRFDLAECLSMFLWTSIVHDDDVLAHSNWELGEDWLRRYGFLVEESVLSNVNKWRRTRGEAELVLSEINPDAAGVNALS